MDSKHTETFNLYYLDWLIGQAGRVFANGPGDCVQSQVASYQKLKKWYLDAALQQYKVRIMGAIQGKEYRLPLHLSVVAIEKGAFGSPSTTVANFTLLTLNMYINFINRKYT